MAPLAAVLGAGNRRSLLSSARIMVNGTPLLLQGLQVQVPHATILSHHGPQHQQAWAQRRAFSSGAPADPEARPPFPPFTFETAKEKVRKAQDGWNTRNPEAVAMAYTPDSHWRNRDTFLQGREAIKAFLSKKWAKEQDYCLMKELWGFHGNRISARFEYEWHDEQGQWWRSHGNEQWEFDAKGLMQRRDASINDVRIKESDRRYIRNPKTGLVEFPQGHPEDKK